MEVGSIVTGTVLNINKTYLLIKLEDGYIGTVHISAVSDYFINNLTSMFKVKNEYNFIVTKISDENKKVKLDWKSIHPRFLKNPFKYEIQETTNGFNNLIKYVEKEVEND